MSNERIQTYEEEIAELRNKHFDTRLDERVATATMFNRLLDELKKMYAREDELLDALQVIKEDLETGIAQGNIPINATNGIDLTKIRNFANDASL